ncbi:hypothetical protein CYLTODRAFT_410297 [Cylindrobasidium torrendii FP15055 ss-10]|uniref:Uncharacterized protein n=1 Tax=Cylindrobasidium torrendii FP15055 ss-10 TaxID=1314674 RepID=A0A0D7BDE0_9AGAR|nr:hypothetical protein CYLTODRAFT_410297 [Cylindrobasidium torrendii FP15055 ss-10]
MALSANSQALQTTLTFVSALVDGISTSSAGGIGRVGRRNRIRGRSSSEPRSICNACVRDVLGVGKRGKGGGLCVSGWVGGGMNGIRLPESVLVILMLNLLVKV